MCSKLIKREDEKSMDINLKRFKFYLTCPLEPTWMDDTKHDYLFTRHSDRLDWQTHAFYMLSKGGKHISEHVCSMDTLITTLKSEHKKGYSISLLNHSLSKKQAYDLKAQWQECLIWWGINKTKSQTDRDHGQQFKK